MRGRLERLEHKFSEPDVPADLPLTEEQRWERITLLLAHCDSGEATDDEQQRASTIRHVFPPHLMSVGGKGSSGPACS